MSIPLDKQKKILITNTKIADFFQAPQMDQIKLLQKQTKSTL